ncbi:MAG: matrixin family metalloprotease [Myxococcales bacterium]|nr:matrixin family metalloprotease [Polyangiaceae bacterium]MDW8248499.1 matrixin family metalloprotease [Myxococcales bacterium]
MSHRFRWFAVASALWFLPLEAAAFCRTTTCDPVSTSCEEMPDNPGCTAQGVPLAWPIRCIGVALQEDASRQVSYEEFDRVARAAFDAWNTVDCGGKPPSIQVQVLGSTPCGAQEFNRNLGNANILVFREDTWPYQGQSSVLALTTLTFGVETGIIYDADMEINAVPSRVTLTTRDQGVKIDLQSILTHEAGHLLGLAHSSVEGATMTPIYQPGTISFRDLHPDDVEGLCSAYPPDRARLPACDFSGPTPESQGFSRLCGGTDKQAPLPEEDEGNCGCKEVGRRGEKRGMGGILLVMLLRRRRA